MQSRINLPAFSLLTINGSVHGSGELISFSDEGSEIIFSNLQASPVDLILFGGEPYTEPIEQKDLL